MSLNQLVRRHNGAGYQVSTTKTNSGRWGIRIVDADGIPNEEIRIFTIVGLDRNKINPNINVINIKGAETENEIVKKVYIATNKNRL